MNLYGLFILDVNIKYIVFSILYRHINVPLACKELNILVSYNCVQKVIVIIISHWYLLGIDIM